MRKLMNLDADMTKLMVSLSRKWGRTNRHTPLKEQLAVNRGRAMGLPRKLPNTRYQRKVADARQRRWIERMKLPF